MEKIKGDILLFNYDKFMTGKWKLLNKLIKKIDGDINHTALYYGGGYVIESWESSGVRKRKLWVNETYEVWRVKNITIGKELDDYFTETKGVRYSWKDWANVAIVKVVHKLTGKYIKFLKSDDSGFICSEYVNNFFIEKHGKDVCKFTNFESPNDFRKSQEAERIKQ